METVQELILKDKEIARLGQENTRLLSVNGLQNERPYSIVAWTVAENQGRVVRRMLTMHFLRRVKKKMWKSL
jgi:hypothetical protein